MNLERFLDYIQLKSCCWCISLKTGTKIFGFISMVSSLFLMMASTLFFTVNIHRGFGRGMVLITLDIVTQLIQTITSFLLILGVYQAKRNLLPYWLASTVVYAILEAIILPSLIWRFLLIGEFVFNFTLIYELSFVMIVEDIYGWLVVFSYYKTLSTHGNELV